MSYGRCESCRHWEKDPTSGGTIISGTCSALPPTIGANGRADYPTTCGHHGCGSWTVNPDWVGNTAAYLGQIHDLREQLDAMTAARDTARAVLNAIKARMRNTDN